MPKGGCARPGASAPRGYRSPAWGDLRVVLDDYDEYVVQDNDHRPHRARNLRPPDHDVGAAAVTDLATARMRRRKGLGRPIHDYERAARRTPDQA